MDQQLFSKEIGDAIRARRKNAGLTIHQLAEMAGIDAGFLAYIETGKKLPSLVTAGKLARALDLTLSGLFEGVAARQEPPRYRLEKQLHSLFHDRTASQAEELLELLRGLKDPKTVKALRQLIGR